MRSSRSTPSLIVRYTTQLRRYLWMNNAITRDILAEVQSHLEEKVGMLMDQGQDRPAAEQLAITEFGDARTIGSRLNAAHPLQLRFIWGGALWLAGGFCAWGCWYLWTYIGLATFALTTHPAVLYDGTATQSSVASESVPFYRFFFDSSNYGQYYQAADALSFSPWHYIPMILLFAAIPYIVAPYFGRWWLPAMWYGVGGATVFGLYAAKLFKVQIIVSHATFPTETYVILVFLIIAPVAVALLSALLAHFWQQKVIAPRRTTLDTSVLLPNLRNLTLVAALTMIMAILVIAGLNLQLQSYKMAANADATTRFTTFARHVAFPVHQPHPLQPSDQWGLDFVTTNCYICIAAAGQEMIIADYVNEGDTGAVLSIVISNQPPLVLAPYHTLGNIAVTYQTIQAFPQTQSEQLRLDGNAVTGWYLDQTGLFISHTLVFHYDHAWYMLDSYALTRAQLEALASSF